MKDWQFNVDGQRVTVTVHERVLSNNAEVLRQAAIAGHGIALLAGWLVADDVQHGHLVRVLPEHAVAPAAVDASINIVYLPINRSTRIKVFSRFIKGCSALPSRPRQQMFCTTGVGTLQATEA
jgi:DNA-binding transcriptional LysR family regulator